VIEKDAVSAASFRGSLFDSLFKKKEKSRKSSHADQARTSG
jgi:hypothetical protein